MKTILSLGDCNTLGVRDCERNAYPERLAALLGAKVHNCGHTMSTTREGLAYFNEYKQSSPDIITIQFGIVDSWETFKYSPYVYYYPDSPWRKLLRKLVKKYKKYAKKLGLNRLLGVKNVVSLHEYKANIQQIIDGAPGSVVCLIDTTPNMDASRNPRIEAYNQALSDLAALNGCIKINVYGYFESRMTEEYFLDGTHIAGVSHQFVAERIAESLSAYESDDDGLSIAKGME